MAPSRSRSKRPRGLSRIDQPSTRTFGWFVRIGYHERRDGSYGPRHTKFFGDVGYGGKRKSQKAAEKFIASLGAKPKKAGKAKKAKRPAARTRRKRR